MRTATRLLKRLVITCGLIALVVVLFPDYTRPLWEWGQSIGTAIGYDGIPSFATTQGLAGLSLLVLFFVGAIYNLWRDRRFEVLQAEYTYQTGAKHLKEKVQELENQVDKVTAERDDWQQQYARLNQQHTATLVAAKENEVHRKFGEGDREELQQLRRRFEELLKEKGHIEGLRIAMDYMMNDLSNESDPPNVSLKTSGEKSGNGNTRPGQQKSAIPFERNTRS